MFKVNPFNNPPPPLEQPPVTKKHVELPTENGESQVPHSEAGIDESNSLENRDSIDFFVRLREEIQLQIGFSDPGYLISLLDKYKDLNFHMNIDGLEDELEKRKRTRVFLNKFNDLFRRSLNETEKKNFPHVNMRTEGTFSFVEIKTEDLILLKALSFECITQYAKHLSFLNDITPNELDEEVKGFLKKYEGEKVFDLFYPDIKLKGEDYYIAVSSILNSLNFRNRKINEFVAYRYARTAPLDLDLEDFIRNAHIIANPSVWSTVGTYRRYSVSIGHNESLAPVIGKKVGYFMEQFSEDVSKFASSDRQKILKEILKKYVLLEWIHPFSDGNGRVGRALFVYLQRKYGLSSKGHLVHIPVARYESSTQHVQDYLKQVPGSLSLAVTLKVKELFSKLTNERGKDITYQDMRQALEGQEIQDDLDSLLEIIKKESELDSSQNQDWIKVFESAEHVLEKEEDLKVS